MDWQVIEKMRGREDSMEETKGNKEVDMKRDGKNETEGPRKNENRSTLKTTKEVMENVVRKEEGTPNGVALSNHRFDPFPIYPGSFLKQEFSIF